MTKAIWGVTLGLGITLGLATAHAQQKSPAVPKPDEKASADDTLQKGTGGARPWATGVTPEQQKAALAPFREGNGHLNEGLFARASESYRQALKHWDHPAINYNLALALMNLDQPIEAFESLEKAVRYGEAPLEKDKLEHAREYMLLLEKQIAKIEVSCDKPGAKVSLDGKEVFIAPGKHTARVRIGRHTFVADKKGYQTRITAPFIGPGETFRIELKLYTAEELTRYNRRWEATWMPYTVVGGGIALGLGGGALQLAANSSYNSYDKQVAACNVDNMGCPTTPELTRSRDRGDLLKTLGYVSYGVAGAAVAAGVVLIIVNRPEAYQIRPEDLQDEQDKPRVSITPIVTPEIAGAMLYGHF